MLRRKERQGLPEVSVFFMVFYFMATRLNEESIGIQKHIRNLFIILLYHLMAPILF